MQRPGYKQTHWVYLDLNAYIEGDRGYDDCCSRGREKSCAQKSAEKDIGTLGSKKNITQATILHVAGNLVKSQKGNIISPYNNITVKSLIVSRKAGKAMYVENSIR